MMYANTVRGCIGGLLAVVLLLAFQNYLVGKANKDRKNDAPLKFMDLVITSEDNAYSLSRFQIYMWTLWVVIAFAVVSFYSCQFPEIPSNIAILLGINALTAAVSTAITPPKESLTRQSAPSFYRDIFLDKNGTLDLPRTQMFIWTIVILVTHIFIFATDYFNGQVHIPDVKEGLLILMGVSNGAYLGVKAASEKK